MTVLYIILTLVLLFVCVLLTNVVLVSRQARKPGDFVAWKTEEQQRAYAERLAKMIRRKTVSVKGKL